MSHSCATTIEVRRGRPDTSDAPGATNHHTATVVEALTGHEAGTEGSPEGVEWLSRSLLA